MLGCLDWLHSRIGRMFGCLDWLHSRIGRMLRLVARQAIKGPIRPTYCTTVTIGRGCTLQSKVFKKSKFYFFKEQLEMRASTICTVLTLQRPMGQVTLLSTTSSLFSPPPTVCRFASLILHPTYPGVNLVLRR